MKIVIDIPEEVKEKIAIMGLDRLDVWNIRLVSKAISDGTPLDDLKAIYIGMNGNAVQIYPNNDALDKIRSELEDYITHSPYIKSFMDCVRLRDDVMRIIDKYRNEVNE